MARPAVNDVSLRVEPSQFVVLLGPSGCGKTTLLKLVNRLYEPTNGKILIDGQPTHVVSAPELRRKIGYVVQQSGLFPHMRIEDNIAVVPKLLKWDKRRTSTRIDELLELVGLPPKAYRRRYPAQLSGGEQQRVGLARAMAARPSTLLMDEPFGALDAITRNRLQRELKRIHQQLGQTVLFVTHDVEEAVRLADRIVVMRGGQVVQYDVPERIVLRPADQFVSDLLGSDDVLRRLSLMPVTSAMLPLDGAVPDGGPNVESTLSLRDALSRLLESSAPGVTVVDAEGKPLGSIDLPTILGQSAVEPQAVDPGSPSSGFLDFSEPSGR
ncbi:MAG TPA: ABC transporter ATP-binding protein [Nitrolancea sp.]|nr:ABC transporter ATP-binding protein [Nitrolancea sp.]